MLEFQRAFFVALHGFLDEILDEIQQVGGQFDDGARRELDDVAVVRDGFQRIREGDRRSVCRLQLAVRLEPVLRLMAGRDGELGLRRGGHVRADLRRPEDEPVRREYAACAFHELPDFLRILQADAFPRIVR